MAEPLAVGSFELQPRNSELKSVPATTCLDVVLALSAVFLLPWCCQVLLQAWGAAPALLLYYVVYSLAIVRWRRGTFGYCLPEKILRCRSQQNSRERRDSFRFLIAFCAVLAVQILAQVASFSTIEPDLDKSWSQVGFLLTLLVWAPSNAMLEQLSWLYCFDAFDKYGLSPDQPLSKPRQVLQCVVGLLACLALVGTIHVFFWTRFLPEFRREEPWHTFLFATRFIVTPGYVLLREWSQSMTPVAMIHVLSDVCLVLGAQYDILPRLFRPLA